MSAALFINIATTTAIDFTQWGHSAGAKNISPTSFDATLTPAQNTYILSGAPTGAGTFCYSLVPPTTNGVTLSVRIKSGEGFSIHLMETVWTLSTTNNNQVTFNWWDQNGVSIYSATTQLTGSLTAYYCHTWNIQGNAAFYYNGAQILSKTISDFGINLQPEIITYGSGTGVAHFSNGYLSAVQTPAGSSLLLPPGNQNTATTTKPVTNYPISTPSLTPTSKPSAVPSVTPSIAPVPKVISVPIATFTPSFRPSTKPLATPTVASALAQLYGQCGGLTYTGPTTCPTGSTCVYNGIYYSQCVPHA